MRFYNITTAEGSAEMVKNIKEQVDRELKKVEEDGGWAKMVEKAFISANTHEECGSTDTAYIGGFSTMAACGCEEERSLHFCNKCATYYLDIFHDSFMGDPLSFQEVVSVVGESVAGK